MKALLKTNRNSKERIEINFEGIDLEEPDNYEVIFQKKIFYNDISFNVIPPNCSVSKSIIFNSNSSFKSAFSYSIFAFSTLFKIPFSPIVKP